MKKKFRKATISCQNQKEACPVKIVSDASISSRGTVEGKLIPLVIIDTSDRPDIEELVRVHEQKISGDIICQWVQLVGTKGKIALYLKFIRPAELIIILEFDILRQGILVDQALASRAIYIQPGKDGDRLSTTINNPRILIEVPSTNFEEEWEKLFLKHIVLYMRKEGIQRNQAKQAARRVLDEMRKFGKFRLKRS
ncbi:MAG TPA: hypothetical protein VM123_00295 [archaeon]|nr:hypothetical protein [archaeon]